MKNIHLVICLTVVAVLSHSTAVLADSFDSDKATVKKASAKTAKVCVDKKTYTVPVKFADGANWSNVKDHYELSDASLKCLKSGNCSISVGSDGGLTWGK